MTRGYLLIAVIIALGVLCMVCPVLCAMVGGM